MSIVTDQSVDGTQKHQTIFRTINMQAITHTRILNHFGILVFSSMYIHKIRFIMTSTIEAEFTDIPFISRNHMIANAE